MAITKEQVSDLRSAINELIGAELEFKRVESRVQSARNSLDYQIINCQKLDKKLDQV